MRTVILVCVDEQPLEPCLVEVTAHIGRRSLIRQPDSPGDIAADQIASRGFAIIPLRKTEKHLSDLVQQLGREFFALPVNLKLLSATEDRNAGFRTVGQEYSQDPSRPDLNESYSVWGGVEAPLYDESSNPLTSAMIDWQQVLGPLVADLLEALRLQVSSTPRKQPINFMRSSYAQLNHYVADGESAKREFLQDAHEDGHLITLLVTQRPGLETGRTISGPFSPVPPSANQLLIMPGSALTAVSDGLFAPMYHRVRSLNLPERFSLMYFVNPDVTRPVYSWVSTDNECDLAPIIAAKPQQFGLPSVPNE